MPGPPASSVHFWYDASSDSGLLLPAAEDRRGVRGAVADQRVVVAHGVAEVVLAGLLRARGELGEALAGCVPVAHLHRHHRQRLALVELHATEGRPLADPRLDVLGVVDVLALLADGVVPDRLDDVGVRAHAGVLAEAGELAQRLDGLDLLAARGVQVDADHGEGRGGQHLGRAWSATGEELPGGEAATGEDDDRDHGGHDRDDAVALLRRGRLGRYDGQRLGLVAHDLPGVCEQSGLTSRQSPDD